MIKPYYETELGKLYCGDCLEIMKDMPDKSVDLVLTDPPYGINKAEWDKQYPKGIEKELLRIGTTVAVACGQWAIPLCVESLGKEYLGIIALYNRNGMTFSPLGFGNWIPLVIAGKRPKSGRDLLGFNVYGNKPDHPSPKPLMSFKKSVTRLSNKDSLILDQFLGSGTTAVACEQLGRRWIGIEISEKYCEIAKQRIKAEADQEKML